MVILLAFVALLGGATTTVLMWPLGWVLALGFAPVGGSALAVGVAVLYAISNHLQQRPTARPARRGTPA
jgi:hypothetical protein